MRVCTDDVMVMWLLCGCGVEIQQNPDPSCPNCTTCTNCAIKRCVRVRVKSCPTNHDMPITHATNNQSLTDCHPKPPKQHCFVKHVQQAKWIKCNNRLQWQAPMSASLSIEWWMAALATQRCMLHASMHMQQWPRC
jgi:hypothetical protein